jgi:hypothetical protein
MLIVPYKLLEPLDVDASRRALLFTVSHAGWRLWLDVADVLPVSLGW